MISAEAHIETEHPGRHCQVVQRLGWPGCLHPGCGSAATWGQAAAGTPTTSFQAVNRVSISWR